jgi:hypothetical protein
MLDQRKPEVSFKNSAIKKSGTGEGRKPRVKRRFEKVRGM